jgi:hypothetical protein
VLSIALEVSFEILMIMSILRSLDSHGFKHTNDLLRVNAAALQRKTVALRYAYQRLQQTPLFLNELIFVSHHQPIHHLLLII